MVKINYKEKKLLDAESQKDASFMVEETSLNIQQDVIATKRQLKVKKVELDDIKSSYPLDLQRYINTKGDIEALENALTAIAELQEELGFEVTAKN